MAKIRNQNIEMETGKTVDGRDVSEDGKKLDQATYRNVPNTLVMRDNTGYADILVSAALKLNTPRKFTFFGDLDAISIFDGTQDVFVEVRIRNDSHRHDVDYYTKTEIDNIVNTLSVGTHIHAIIRSGEGIRFFNYNGSIDQSVEVSWAGITGDWGMETKHAARSDHKHDILYYPREEALNEFLVKLDSSADNIRVFDGKNNVHNSIQVPWALRLGHTYGQSGLSLNSTNINNEANKVGRTDNNGYTNFSKIKTYINDINSSITSVYIDLGDSYISKCNISYIFSYSGIVGNEVIQHGHTKLWSVSHPVAYYVYSEYNGTYWRLKSNHASGISVAHADLASTAKYADLAEIYKIKNSTNIVQGTVLSVCSNKKWEAEQCETECSHSVIGVLSDKPGFTLNAKDADKPNCLPVALKGKNTIRVFGKVGKGDALVSYLHGTARKIKHNNELLYSFAIALESNLNDAEKLVYCYIK